MAPQFETTCALFLRKRYRKISGQKWQRSIHYV